MALTFTRVSLSQPIQYIFHTVHDLIPGCPLDQDIYRREKTMEMKSQNLKTKMATFPKLTKTLGNGADKSTQTKRIKFRWTPCKLI